MIAAGLLGPWWPVFWLIAFVVGWQVKGWVTRRSTLRRVNDDPGGITEWQLTVGRFRVGWSFQSTATGRSLNFGVAMGRRSR